MQFKVSLENFEMSANRGFNDDESVPVNAASHFYGDDVNVRIETNWEDHGVPSTLMCVGEKYVITVEKFEEQP